MGQKVNPQGFRLGVSQPHLSHWFAKNRQYSQLLLEDNFLRESISKKFVNAGIANIAIEREVDTIRIKISSAYPRQFLSAFNQDKHVYTGLESLRDQLTTELRTYRQNRFVHKKQNKALRVKKQDSNLAGDGNKQHQNEGASSQQAYPEESTQAVAVQSSAFYITIHLTKVADPNRSAACVSESIVEQLEKRVPFRRAMKQAIFRAEKANVKGIKVQISGRLNGAEIARSEWILKGRVPLHTLRAKVQYNFKTAKTIYGLLGVKVWVFADDT